MQYHCVCLRFRVGNEQEFTSVLEDNPNFYDNIEYLEVEDDTAFNISLEKEKDRVDDEMFKHRPR